MTQWMLNSADENSINSRLKLTNYTTWMFIMLAIILANSKASSVQFRQATFQSQTIIMENLWTLHRNKLKSGSISGRSGCHSNILIYSCFCQHTGRCFRIPTILKGPLIPSQRILGLSRAGQNLLRMKPLGLLVVEKQVVEKVKIGCDSKKWRPLKSTVLCGEIFRI